MRKTDTLAKTEGVSYRNMGHSPSLFAAQKSSPLSEGAMIMRMLLDVSIFPVFAGFQKCFL